MPPSKYQILQMILSSSSSARSSNTNSLIRLKNGYKFTKVPSYKTSDQGNHHHHHHPPPRNVSKVNKKNNLFGNLLVLSQASTSLWLPLSLSSSSSLNSSLFPVDNPWCWWWLVDGLTTWPYKHSLVLFRDHRPRNKKLQMPPVTPKMPIRSSPVPRIL